MKGFCVIHFINTDAIFINTDAIFINTDAIKMPTYGTKVPYNGHICALSGAMIQKGKNFPSFKVA